ncbi:hypothetical protein AMELA_G00223970 [Ameiurus melas]|uniref:Uncharacterized protein n=1 Tax=Ameiurus melas TaxID=219545 RepID=A0A7J5ZZL4_AMEME|nr:hypothetical protein AMELA_G00223970 [Ameiurus melas]
MNNTWCRLSWKHRYLRSRIPSLRCEVYDRNICLLRYQRLYDFLVYHDSLPASDYAFGSSALYNASACLPRRRPWIIPHSFHAVFAVGLHLLPRLCPPHRLTKWKHQQHFTVIEDPLSQPTGVCIWIIL